MLRAVLVISGALITIGCADNWSVAEVQGTVSLEGVPVASGFASLTTGGPGVAYGDVIDGRYEIIAPIDTPLCEAMGIAVAAENPNRFVGEARVEIGSCGEHTIDFDFVHSTVRGTVSVDGQPYDHAQIWVTLDGVPPDVANAVVAGGAYETYEFVVERRACATYRVHAAIYDGTGFVAEQERIAGGCGLQTVDFAF